MPFEAVDAGAPVIARWGEVESRAAEPAARPVRVHGPAHTEAAACERVLRSLPDWFGIEDSLRMHALNTTRQLTFAAEDDGQLIGFMSLVPGAGGGWEIDCVAVDAAWRGRGVGRRLQVHAEAWLAGRGAQCMRVRTLAESHPSPAYAQTRAFYEAVGYVTEDGEGWGLHLPVVQMVKALMPPAPVPPAVSEGAGIGA